MGLLIRGKETWVFLLFSLISLQKLYLWIAIYLLFQTSLTSDYLVGVVNARYDQDIFLILDPIKSSVRGKIPR